MRDKVVLLTIVCLVALLHSNAMPLFTGVYMLDVGQGDSFLFVSEDNKLILIDTGEGIESLSELSSILPFYYRNIDTLILTHPDVDHIGGIDYLLKRYHIQCLVMTKHTLDRLGEYGVNISSNADNVYTDQSSIDINKCFGNSVDVKFFNFTDGYVHGDNTNADSIITSIKSGDKGYLFLGDATTEILDIINVDGVKCDVITAGHHGSKYSVSKKLLSECHPFVALISVGKDNRYGHPSKEALDSYIERDIDVLRTDQRGTLLITFYKDTMIVKKPFNLMNLFHQQRSPVTD